MSLCRNAYLQEYGLEQEVQSNVCILCILWSVQHDTASADDLMYIQVYTWPAKHCMSMTFRTWYTL